MEEFSAKAGRHPVSTDVLAMYTLRLTFTMQKEAEAEAC